MKLAAAATASVTHTGPTRKTSRERGFISIPTIPSSVSSVRPRLLSLSLPCTHARCSSILPSAVASGH